MGDSIKKSNILLNKRESFLIFLSGLLMTIIPAKIGEMITAVYLKRKGVKYRKSFPIIITERIYDVIGVIFLLKSNTNLIF